MQSLWNETDAARQTSLLAQRVYTSRLLGQNQALVLHGGGNTSVKIRERNIFGDEEELLYVKGSGWDLETIEAAGFAPVRMAHLLRLATLDQLSDTQMANELRVATINPAAPAPSVEAILHAILPFTFVDHSHADAVVTLTNTPHGRDHVREVYGDSVVIIPYVMPGFELARVCAEIYRRESTAHTVGMVLMNHGLFTFANSARESYEKHIELVTKAEEYLQVRNAWTIAIPHGEAAAEPQRHAIAALRKEVSSAAGAPMILATHSDAACLAFARRPDLAQLALQGPATPDHVIRTKRVPLLGRDVAEYVQAYKDYFAEHAAHSSQQLTMLDPAPRVLLDQELGLVTIGRTARDAAIAEDIYRHTMEIVQRATLLEAWQALPASDLFAVEYWDLEQAKLRRQGAPPAFAGEVALVTGAASGIGKACVEALLKRGAAVVGLDVNPAIETSFKRPDYLGLPCDITDEAALAATLETAVRRFGGLDMVILNAGIFPSSKKIANLPLEEWQRVMKVNLDANLSLLRECHPLLKQAPRGGRVVAIASKNVPAPGPGAAAYSASKAALTQLARLAALEWGGDGIRVNILHPNAVFDTGIWTEELLQTRATSYGMTVDEYKTNNVLHVEITSRDVAELAAELCGPAFARTTGAQIPIDGGNERVI